MDLKGKYLVVTGGAGFIGSAFVWEMNRRNFDSIIVVDHLDSSEKRSNLRGLKFADYFEKDSFLKILRESPLASSIGGIVHLGACSSTTEPDASYLAENNFSYTKELANFAMSRKIRFATASSAATYGDGSMGWDDDESKLDSLRPLNMYGYSKHLLDLWAKRKGLLGGICSVKFSNVFGPNEWHKGEMRSVACKAFEQIRDTGKIRLFKSLNPDFGDGEQKRDFIYVKDAVKMLLFLVERGKSGIFNVSSGKAETWNSLAGAMFRALGKPTQIEYIPMPEKLAEKYQYYTCAKNDKLRGEGYSEELFPLDDAVRDYVVSYLSTGRRIAD